VLSTAALTPTAQGTGADEVASARARLGATLAEVTALDVEVDALSAELASFAAELERRLHALDLAARRAAATVRRIQALAAALAEERARVQAGPGVTERPRTPRRSRTARASAPPPPADEEDPEEPAQQDGDDDEAPDAEAAAREAAPHADALRRVYRRLARLLHPDLAGDDAERERLTAAMAQVNAAYAAGDLQALELTAEKVGAGEAPGLVTDEERLLDLRRRQEQLSRVAASLRRTLQGLRDSDTARLRAEARRVEATGGDYFAVSEAELRAEAVAARADAVARLPGLERAAKALADARRDAMADIERRGTARAFDPLAESAVVRRSAGRLERAQAGPEARALARWLEDAALASPWEAALTLLAFYAEAGGERPPPSIASAAGLAERWEALRPSWPGAPDLGGALGALPSHLVVGARAGREAVQAGLQLAREGLSAGVHLALAHPAVAELAAEVLAALGPELRCEACARAVRALHVLATRGLDERHALLCPGCGATLQRYWRFGAVEGLEALAPLSLQVGLTAEVVVRLGSASLGFGLRPEDRASLTAGGLLERFGALYLEPCAV
jgi:hypothetical protein